MSIVATRPHITRVMCAKFAALQAIATKSSTCDPDVTGVPINGLGLPGRRHNLGGITGVFRFQRLDLSQLLSPPSPSIPVNKTIRLSMSMGGRAGTDTSNNPISHGSRGRAK